MKLLGMFYVSLLMLLAGCGVQQPSSSAKTDISAGSFSQEQSRRRASAERKRRNHEKLRSLNLQATAQMNEGEPSFTRAHHLQDVLEGRHLGYRSFHAEMLDCSEKNLETGAIRISRLKLYINRSSWHRRNNAVEKLEFGIEWTSYQTPFKKHGTVSDIDRKGVIVRSHDEDYDEEIGESRYFYFSSDEQEDGKLRLSVRSVPATSPYYDEEFASEVYCYSYIP